MRRLQNILQESTGWGVGVFLTLSVGLLLLIQRTGADGERLGKGLINRSYNLPFIPRPTIPVSGDRAVLVLMDNDSHDFLGQRKNAPWDRGLHAKLLHRLQADGAAGAVFDIVFSDPGPDPVKDKEFADAMKSFGKVILAADYETSIQNGIVGKTIVLPIDSFVDAANDIGLALVRADNDLVVRTHWHGDKNDDLLPSMSWVAAKMVGASVTTNDDSRSATRWVNYYGPAGSVPGISYFQALSTNLPAGYFSNKVVFIGSKLLTKFAGDRKDEYPTPFSSTSQENRFTPGVEIQATLFLNLIRGDWLIRPPESVETMIIIVVGVIFGVGLVQIKRPVICTVVAGGAILVSLVLVYYLFAYKRIWFSWFIPVGVQIPVAWIWSVAFNAISLYVQKRLMEQSLSMYVSPKRVSQISRNQEMLKPGAEKQELSIMFSDIANFTSMSEGMDSDELAKLMNSYFEKAVGSCIHPAEGTVVKFIGDAIFAIWNAPERQKNHQELACRGALLLRDEVSAFLNSKGGLDVRTRIGLHSGVANVGNFGSSTRVDYTALGENINLASRMEGLNKYVGTDVLITGDVYKSVSDKYTCRYAGKFRLKGFERAVEVYELVSTKDKAAESQPWRDAFAGALDAYLKKDFDAAETAFKKVIEMRGGKDGPSKYYLKHIAEIRAEPLPDDWDGEIELKDK